MRYTDVGEFHTLLFASPSDLEAVGVRAGVRRLNHASADITSLLCWGREAAARGYTTVVIGTDDAAAIVSYALGLCNISPDRFDTAQDYLDSLTYEVPAEPGYVFMARFPDGTEALSVAYEDGHTADYGYPMVYALHINKMASGAKVVALTEPRKLEL